MRAAWPLRLVAWAVYAFLYAPIVVLVLFSFNQDKRNALWTGFTLSWYPQLAHDPLVQRALWNSLKVGLTATLAATVIGTMAALALARCRFRGRSLVGGLLFLPLVVPEIVMGTALMTFFVALKVRLSIYTVMIAHIAFCISYVTITVRARLAGMDTSLEEAAADLGADPFTTFRLVTLPRILPGVVSGALLCFTLSLDDFVITFFTTGIGAQTLPLKIYSMVKFGITPEINALSTLLLAATFTLMLLFGRLERQVKDPQAS
ncbi:MAG: ABC transporter permease [Candidatus Eremiobacterota bacterium]